MLLSPDGDAADGEAAADNGGSGMELRLCTRGGGSRGVERRRFERRSASCGGLREEGEAVAFCQAAARAMPRARDRGETFFPA